MSKGRFDGIQFINVDTVDDAICLLQAYDEILENEQSGGLATDDDKEGDE